ncbi:MAG: hypothetical protein AB7J28_17345 [Hyphomonadaceae bacterium]
MQLSDPACKAKLRAVLEDAGIEPTDWRLEDLCYYVEMGRAAKAQVDAEVRMTRRDASRLIAAVRRIEEIAKRNRLADHADVEAALRLERLATEASTGLPPGPRQRRWIFATVDNFAWLYASWAAPNPKGLWITDGEPSPALRFVVACYRVIDPSVSLQTVSHNARQYAREASIDDEERERAYEAWASADNARRTALSTDT